ncbi:P-loop containing nucleoside triphosphate hydrolase protein [Xylariaceae sp. FL0016]|nr:P-loop containing nucleoside triphosphate hydrolase protein [Xylariaceae sp. FL0016]
MPSASSSKRSRRAAFQEDPEDVTGIAEASSSSRTDPRKKARFSKASLDQKSAYTPGHDASDPGEDEAIQDFETLPTPPPATQYELMRDAGWKHLDHAQLDDERATQRFQQRPTLIGDNHAAMNAIIQEITCINFMCHQKLVVKLGPLLNFIVGENGSGKSAVLTAITLCLGGKASATNRGGSLRNFVKEGTDNAILTIKIKNEGEDAYKPDLFGDSIICERWFTRSGASGFKLKSSANRIISTKKMDVDDVVEYYCLQVDNPLNVLSQDNARQFLNAATPATKYKYFVQGTQLEQLDTDYQILTEILDANEAKLSEHHENISYLKERYEKAVKLRDAVGKSAEMRIRSKVYQKQLAWAQVQDQEDILKQKEEAIRASEEEILHTEEDISEKSRYLDSIDGKIQQAEESLELIRQEGGQAQEQEEGANAEYQAAKTEIQALHTQERDMHSNLNRVTSVVRDLSKDIQKEEERIESINGGALAEKQRELDEAQNAVAGLEQAIDTHRSGYGPLMDDLKAAETRLKEIGEPIRDKKTDISATEDRIRMLSQKQIDPLAGYHRAIPQLLKLIENDSRFQNKPVGPIGTFISLGEAQWSTIVESFLNDRLNAFVVTNRPDQVHLLSLMDRLHVGYPVIIAPVSGIGNRLSEPDEGFSTILRVLKFDNQLVRDALIINNQIEQILLIETLEEVHRVLLDGPSAPRNGSVALCHYAGKRGFGHRVVRKPGTNHSTSTIRPLLSQKPRIKSDVETEIRLQQDNLAQLQSELRSLETSKRTLLQSTQRCGQALAQHKKQSQGLELKLRNASAAVSRIVEDLDNFENVGGKLQGLKAQLADQKARQDHYGNQYGELAVRKKEMNEHVTALKAKLTAAKHVTKDHAAKLNKVQEKIKRFVDARSIALVEKNKAYENLEVAKLRKTDAENKRDEQAETVEAFIKEAETVVRERAYIPEGETYQSVERKYISLREQISKLRKQMGASEEEINNRAAQATQEYREAKTANKNLTSLVDELKKALMDRLSKYRNFQRHVSAHARTNFGYLLSERSFRGQLLLDHRAKKLEVQVEPDETRRAGDGRNTKTLSGGEKSFSSICLLLAIWDAMGSPLRCLDEFDVFMDNVNRAISTNMLIEAARRSVGKQFILITPNAIEGRAKLSKDVKIIRLVDPRQRTLDS